MLRYITLLFMCLCFVSCSKSKGREQVPEDQKTDFDHVSKEYDSVNQKKVIVLKDGLKDESLVCTGFLQADNQELGVNVKGEGNYTNHVLVCKDKEHDVLYYVNYGYDYFIYRQKNGISEPVVEMPAERLFFQDGKLYFVLASYDQYQLQDVTEGNICCYDPVTGAVTRLINTKVSTMFVYSDGIYYKTQERTGKSVSNGLDIVSEKLYYYSFVTATTKEIALKDTSIYRWKDYFVAEEMEKVDEGDEVYQIYGDSQILYRVIGLKLVAIDGEKKMDLTSQSSQQCYSIVGDTFCYIDGGRKFITIDLKTGEKKEIILQKECTGDFTLLDDKIYLSSLFQVDLKTGNQSYIIPQKQGEQIYELYTDGSQLYGLCGSVNGGQVAVMKQIELKETQETAGMYTDETGNQYEIMRYSFYSLPMGGNYQ